MKKINFTDEHKMKLNSLLLEFLLSGDTISGIAGTSINAYQLLHTTSIKTLQTLFANLLKEIENMSKLDQWSMTDYQQKLITEKQKTCDLINLVIGYKKFLQEKENTAEILKMKKTELQALKDSNRSPAERIAELEKEIQEYSS